MNSHVQQALDGDRVDIRLTSAEREELRQSEAQIDAVLSAISVQALPDLSSGVLARVRQRDIRLTREVAAAAPVGRGGLAAWLWRPRAISIGFRPAYALAAAVVALVIGAQTTRSRPGPAETPLVFTQFVLRAPDASRVSLAGDFTGWKPTYTMTRDAQQGVWTVVIPLEPGVHTYAFVVDGERWTPDPMAPSIDDGFGGVNSRVAVLTPDARKS
jgi:hypothetical protein